MSLITLILSSMLHAQAAPSAVDPSSFEHADTTSLLRHGWMLRWEGRHAEARPYAVSVLQQHDTSLAAHWLYLNTQFADSEDLVQQYRGWHKAAPDDPIRSAALAASIMVNERDAGEWCDEAEGLLDVYMEVPKQAAWVYKLRYLVHRTCGLDTRPDLAALENMAGEDPDAARYHLRAQIQANQIDEALIHDITRLTAADPWVLNDIRALWGRGIQDSRWTRKARRVAEDAAREAGRSESVLDQYSAWRLLRWAQDPMADDIRQRLDAHLGVEVDAEQIESGLLMGELYDADKSSVPELALARLEELSEKVPEHGPHRAVLEDLRGDRLSSLGQQEEALVSYRRAWEEEPSPSNANAFAWLAAITEQDMARALDAVTSGIDDLLSRTVTDASYWQSHTDWKAGYAWQAAAYLDTRGWLLFKMGRNTEALPDLLLSVSLDEMEANHHHLAMVLLELGEEAAAFENLVQAAVCAGGSPSDDVLSALERAYPGSGVWHPGGLSGYIEHRSMRDGSDEKEDDDGAHALLGALFQFSSYTDIHGVEQPLTPNGDILVVDFWATWCGPCVQGMPHLQQLAEAYADQGVRVISLSVDDALSKVESFFSGEFQPAYAVGWVGGSGFETGQFSGIPTMFVVDGQGQVDAYISGYEEGDTRLERALDALLEQEGS